MWKKKHDRHSLIYQNLPSKQFLPKEHSTSLAQQWTPDCLVLCALTALRGRFCHGTQRQTTKKKKKERTEKGKKHCAMMYCRNQRKSGTTRCVTRSRGPQSNKGPFNLFSKLSINVKLTIYIFFPFPRSYSLQRTLCHDWRATKKSLLSTITLLLLLAYNSARS